MGHRRCRRIRWPALILHTGHTASATALQVAPADCECLPTPSEQDSAAVVRRDTAWNFVGEHAHLMTEAIKGPQRRHQRSAEASMPTLPLSSAEPKRPVMRTKQPSCRHCARVTACGITFCTQISGDHEAAPGLPAAMSRSRRRRPMQSSSAAMRRDAAGKRVWLRGDQGDAASSSTRAGGSLGVPRLERSRARCTGVHAGRPRFACTSAPARSILRTRCTGHTSR